VGKITVTVNKISNKFNNTLMKKILRTMDIMLLQWETNMVNMEEYLDLQVNITNLILMEDQDNNSNNINNKKILMPKWD